MDAFFASVEQRDHPELRGKPVIVGGTPNGRGVVASASYEARKFGVRSAMSAAHAKRLCPEAIFVRSDFTAYLEASKAIREIFYEVTELVEPLSVDEAFLDVTENHFGEPLAGKLAHYLKRRIWESTRLVASAGVSNCKLVAKLASDHDKPNGLVIIPPDQVDAFLKPLAVERLWGVGPKTAERIRDMGASTIEALRAFSKKQLESQLGSYGAHLFDLARGQDTRRVQVHRVAKSRGAEQTFERDVLDLSRLQQVINGQAERIARSLRRPGRTITLKVRYKDFTTLTRSRTLSAATQDAGLIAQVAAQLLKQTDAGCRPVRLIGVQVSGLLQAHQPVQLELPLESPVFGQSLSLS